MVHFQVRFEQYQDAQRSTSHVDYATLKALAKTAAAAPPGRIGVANFGPPDAGVLDRAPHRDYVGLDAADRDALEALRSRARRDAEADDDEDDDDDASDGEAPDASRAAPRAADVLAAARFAPRGDPTSPFRRAARRRGAFAMHGLRGGSRRHRGARRRGYSEGGRIAAAPRDIPRAVGRRAGAAPRSRAWLLHGFDVAVAAEVAAAERRYARESDSLKRRWRALAPSRGGRVAFKHARRSLIVLFIFKRKTPAVRRRKNSPSRGSLAGAAAAPPSRSR